VSRWGTHEIRYHANAVNNLQGNWCSLGGLLGASIDKPSEFLASATALILTAIGPGWEKTRWRHLFQKCIYCYLAQITLSRAAHIPLRPTRRQPWHLEAFGR
jgi:hypothetical protein